MTALRERYEQRSTARSAITTAVRVDILNRLFPDSYEWLAAPDEMTIVSTDAADAVSGLGIQRVELNMLDATWDSQTKELDLAGLTPVAIPDGPWLRCNGIRAVSAGASLRAVGDITLTADTGGEIVSGIVIGNTKFTGCIYTIPSDERIELLEFGIDIEDPQTGNDDLIGFMDSRRQGETAWNNELVTRILDLADPHSDAVDLSRMKFRVGTDLVLRAITNSSSTDVIGRLSLHRTQGTGLL